MSLILTEIVIVGKAAFAATEYATPCSACNGIRNPSRQSRPCRSAASMPSSVDLRTVYSSAPVYTVPSESNDSRHLSKVSCPDPKAGQHCQSSSAGKLDLFRSDSAPFFSPWLTLLPPPFPFLLKASPSQSSAVTTKKTHLKSTAKEGIFPAGCAPVWPGLSYHSGYRTPLTLAKRSLARWFFAGSLVHRS